MVFPFQYLNWKFLIHFIRWYDSCTVNNSSETILVQFIHPISQNYDEQHNLLERLNGKTLALCLAETWLKKLLPKRVALRTIKPGNKKGRIPIIFPKYGCKNLPQEILKHSRTTRDVQFKECPLTKQKTRPRTDYEWIGKAISKKNR